MIVCSMLQIKHTNKKYDLPFVHHSPYCVQLKHCLSLKSIKVFKIDKWILAHIVIKKDFLVIIKWKII